MQQDGCPAVPAAGDCSARREHCLPRGLRLARHQHAGAMEAGRAVCGAAEPLGESRKGTVQPAEIDLLGEGGAILLRNGLAAAEVK